MRQNKVLRRHHRHASCMGTVVTRKVRKWGKKVSTMGNYGHFSHVKAAAERRRKSSSRGEDYVAFNGSCSTVLSFIAKVFLIGKLITLKVWWIKIERKKVCDLTWRNLWIHPHQSKIPLLTSRHEKGHSFPFSLILIINNHKESLREIFTKRVSIPHRIVFAEFHVLDCSLRHDAKLKGIQELLSTATHRERRRRRTKRSSVKCFTVSWESRLPPLHKKPAQFWFMAQ